MKSPSRMSQMIREKKKKMQENPDVIDSGDSPSMDAGDEMVMHQNEVTDDLDENKPEEHSEEADAESAPSEEQEPMESTARVKLMAHGGMATQETLDEDGVDGGEDEADETAMGPMTPSANMLKSENEEEDWASGHVEQLLADGGELERISRRKERIAKMLANR